MRAPLGGTSKSLLVGLWATILVLAVYVAGGLDRLELWTLDIRFCCASPLTADPRIVCIDIDDRALLEIQRWPWPRDLQAALIDILHEAGLERLLYDIELTEPEPVRTVVPRHADVATDALHLLATDAWANALPDAELGRALQEFGAAYLAFHYTTQRFSSPYAELEHQVAAWLKATPGTAQQSPDALFAAACHAVVHDDATQYDALAVALRQVLNERATLAKATLPAPALLTHAPRVARIAPVLAEHAQAARRCGYVVFEPDVDNVVRRVPLAVAYDGHALGQLAFAVAYDALGLTPEDIEATPQGLKLHLRESGEDFTIPLDARGRALIPWLPQADWASQFTHVPIGAVWQVFDRRQAVRRNQEVIVAGLRALQAQGQFADWSGYAADLERRLKLDDELRLAQYRGADDDVAQIRAWMRQYDDVLADDSVRLAATIEKVASPDPNAGGALVAVRRALAANAAHTRAIADTLERLRTLVRGKIGLLGYTATALADMVPSPAAPRVPGVMAHASVLNGLLTRRAVAWAPLWVNITLAALLGIIATVMSARYGPRIVALVGALATVYVLAAGWLAFYLWMYWIALTPAVGTLALSYISVVVYRYLFVERESRHLARALGQYTSATLARQMAEQPELCRRAEMREVTAVFTDLAGFTRISERIGAARTQRILNTSLGRLSEVLLHYEGMINKFIGDGIFAFWNPVIYPQDDHARRACEAALDMQSGLRQLIDEQLAAGGDEVFGELAMRIGIATGQAIVGPCGSEQKYDYTCIGDSVNVASRLESANKFYGTRILLSGATYELTKGAFAVRYLGGVQVKGKQQAVPIYELLARAGAVDADLAAYAEQFAAAVTAFQGREWAVAEERFSACLTLRPDDLAAQRYVAAVRACAAQPPDEAWSGALELTEK